MADARADGEAAADGEGGAGGTHEPRECMACRGTGQVLSNLGGTESRVSCPWCAGSGIRQADVDAQAAWSGRAPADGEAAEAPEDEPPGA